MHTHDDVLIEYEHRRKLQPRTIGEDRVQTRYQHGGRGQLGKRYDNYHNTVWTLQSTVNAEHHLVLHSL